jgi:hypothetical protein
MMIDEWFACTSPSYSIIAIVVAWTLLSSPFNPSNRSKTWKRVIGDKIFYHLTTQFNTKQLQWVMGNTGTVHKSWTMQNGLPFEVDELGEDARLFWIGKRRTDRVILYFHGTRHFVVVIKSLASSFLQVAHFCSHCKTLRRLFGATSRKN